MALKDLFTEFTFTFTNKKWFNFAIVDFIVSRIGSIAPLLLLHDGALWLDLWQYIKSNVAATGIEKWKKRVK